LVAGRTEHGSQPGSKPSTLAAIIHRGDNYQTAMTIAFSIRFTLFFFLLLVLTNCKNDTDCITPTFTSDSRKSDLGSMSAKRAAPKPVTPIFLDSIKFVAPDSVMGYVEARNKKTNAQIWARQVYKISYDKNLEEDVQDVFIDSMIVKCNYLFVHNEHNQIYKIDLTALKITKL